MGDNKENFMNSYDKYGRNPSQFVLSNILEGTPFMWPNSVDYAEWRHDMADGLGVPAPSVIVVGSARLGYSLNPDHTFKDFGIESDIDVAIVDPPRVGLGPLAKNLLAVDAKKIVYVSCNPSTLARDLKVLTRKYKIRRIQPVDMFPGTAAVEAVVELTRK